MVRSLQRLAKVELGFRAERLLTLEYRLPANKYPEGPQQSAFHQAVVERVRALPGVRGAAAVRALPFSGNGSNVEFELPGQPGANEAGVLRGQLNTVDTGYFAAMGIPLLRGRAFESGDDASTPTVVLINRFMAERHWPGRDPLGRPVHFPGTPARTATIVGVVGDVKHSALDETATAQIYAALPQNPHIFNTLVVRSEAEDPLALAAAVRSAVWSVDGDQPVWKVRSLESLVEGSLGLRRFLVKLMTVYSLLALALAALGLYGVIAYAVASRTHEIGVRMALGAAARDVLGLVLARGLRLAGLGVAAGLLAALALGRAVSGLLFGVSAWDPLTLVSMAGLLLGVALLASWLPARRATRVEPIAALRYE
jgi:putative ABC transport system permease protein